jgi:hypothetical protein
MLSYQRYRVIIPTLTSWEHYHISVPTKSCYHVIIITLSCYHINFPDNLTHWKTILKRNAVWNLQNELFRFAKLFFSLQCEISRNGEFVSQNDETHFDSPSYSIAEVDPIHINCEVTRFLTLGFFHHIVLPSVKNLVILSL